HHQSKNRRTTPDTEGARHDGTKMKPRQRRHGSDWANSKQIQAVKATAVKAHRQRNATKETDDTGGCRRPDDEIATVRWR
ncbi:hypothetical protein HN51_037005, partial [Arachis hypogaea]